MTTLEITGYSKQAMKGIYCGKIGGRADRWSAAV